MANEKRGNMQYVDTAGVLTDKKNVKVVYIVMNATSANSELDLKDNGASENSLSLSVTPSHTTQVFDFSRCPIVFPNGIEVVAIVNCVATLILQEGYKS